MPKIRICFIGIDGSGKTTHGKMLFDGLHTQGINVRYQHLFSKETALLTNRICGEIVRAIERMTSTPTHNLTSYGLKVMLRLFGIVISSWIKYIYDRVKYSSVEVIIYDRYFYDNLVFFAKLIRCPAVMFTAKLVPKPDLILLMSVKPSTSSQRKYEYKLPEIKDMSSLYERLRYILPLHVISTEEMDIAGVHENIYRLFTTLKQDLNFPQQ